MAQSNALVQDNTLLHTVCTVPVGGHGRVDMGVLLRSDVFLCLCDSRLQVGWDPVHPLTANEQILVEVLDSS